MRFRPITKTKRTTDKMREQLYGEACLWQAAAYEAADRLVSSGSSSWPRLSGEHYSTPANVEAETWIGAGERVLLQKLCRSLITVDPLNRSPAFENPCWHFPLFHFAANALLCP